MSKWAVTSVQSLYRDELPILHDDSISTNVFEDNSPLWSRTEELAVVATVALLKIKLLIDLKALDTTTRLVGSKVPREILDHVRGYIPTSPIIAENQTIIRRDNHQETIRDLTDQICVMVKRILFLRIAYRCDLAPFRAVAGGMRADPRKTSELVRYSHVCWAEVPGAEGFVRNIEARFDRYVFYARRTRSA
jgi:hypothetical protein